MEKSSLEYQKNRIRNLVYQINPNWEIEFYVNDINPGTTDIRFRIMDKNTGKIYGSIRADYEWPLSIVEDLDDATLRERIQNII